jgi:hypothetical protein
MRKKPSVIWANSQVTRCSLALLHVHITNHNFGVNRVHRVLICVRNEVVGKGYSYTKCDDPACGASFA